MTNLSKKEADELLERIEKLERQIEEYFGAPPEVSGVPFITPTIRLRMARQFPQLDVEKEYGTFRRAAASTGRTYDRPERAFWAWLDRKAKQHTGYSNAVGRRLSAMADQNRARVRAAISAAERNAGTEGGSDQGE